MACNEKLGLINTYSKLVGRYATEVSKLNEDGGVLSGGDFELAFKKTEDLLQDLAETRIRLQAHLALHGC
jgi:hypothetical protein